MNAVKLFDIADKPFDWIILVPPLGLFLFGFFLTWMENRKIGKFVIKRIGLVLCVAGALAGLFVAGSWLRERHVGARALQTGRCSVVEGVVTDFHPVPPGGHALESFRVQNRTFSYSEYNYTACFNTSLAHGGPVRQGAYLRVYFSDDCILRIDSLSNKE